MDAALALEDEELDFWTRELSSKGSMTGGSQDDGEIIRERVLFEVDVICDSELDRPVDVVRLERAVLDFGNDLAKCESTGVEYSSFTLLDFDEADSCADKSGSRRRRRLRRTQSSVVTGFYTGCRGCRSRRDSDDRRRELRASGSSSATKSSSGEVCRGPSECGNPCTETNIQNGRLYHSHCSDAHKFLQCDAFGGCDERYCALGTVWSQHHTTCVHGTAKANDCEEEDILVESLQSRGFENVKEVKNIRVEKQNCSAGSSECEAGSACCGVGDCQCETISASLCASHNCDLPGVDCCGLDVSVWEETETEFCQISYPYSEECSLHLH